MSVSWYKTIKMSVDTSSPFAPFAAIGFGGIVAGLITFLGNYWIKNRDHYLEVANNKVDTISKQKHYLFQLQQYYAIVHGLIRRIEKIPKEKEKEVDSSSKLLLYYFCNILTVEQKIFEEFGAPQVYDPDAEQILREHRDNVKGALGYMFDEAQHLKLLHLMTANPNFLSYYNFERFIRIYDDDSLYQEFKVKIGEALRDKEWFDTILTSSIIVSQVLNIEVNRIYKLWYKQKRELGYEIVNGVKTTPQELNLRKRPPKVLYYLKENYPSYYSRIHEFFPYEEPS